MTAHSRVAFAMCLAVASTPLAQDRVLLFDPPALNQPLRVTEVGVDQRGRGWSVRRVIELPRHFIVREPVVVAGGRWLAWLGFDGFESSTALVAYEIETGHAAIVGRRRFPLDAILLSDPVRPRVFVVQQQQIVVIDASLNERIIPIPVTSSLWATAAAFGGSRLAVLSSVDSTGLSNNKLLVVVDVEAGAVEATVPMPDTRAIVVTGDGQRLYHAFSAGLDRRIELLALPGGQLMARSGAASPGYLFTLDERRGVLLFDHGTQLVALDARTLTPVGELGPGVFAERKNFTLDQTTSGEAILVRSSEFAPSYFGDCVGTRLDVFDGLTFALANRIGLPGGCSTVAPIPPVPTR